MFYIQLQRRTWQKLHKPIEERCEDFVTCVFYCFVFVSRQYCVFFPSVRCYVVGSNLKAFRVSISRLVQNPGETVTIQTCWQFSVRGLSAEATNAIRTWPSVPQEIHVELISKVWFHFWSPLASTCVVRVSYARSPRIRLPNRMASGLFTSWLSPWFADWYRRISVRAVVSSLYRAVFVPPLVNPLTVITFFCCSWSFCKMWTIFPAKLTQHHKTVDQNVLFVV